MDKLSKIQREKIEAAYRLLTEETTTFGKFEKIRTLVKGFNPKIDQALAECSRVVSKLKKIQKGEVIELATEGLGEDTPQKKKRKKALLLFLGRWKTLKAEIKRVREIYQSHSSKLEKTAQVAHGAKGPWGLITAAVGAVAVDGSPVGRGGSRRNLITISTLGLSMNYELGGEGINLVFDGESLVGRQTTINLGESKTHELVIKCP